MISEVTVAAHTPGLTDALKFWLSAHCTPTGIGWRPIPKDQQADKDLECPDGLLFDTRSENKGESWYRAFLDGAILLTSRLSTLGVCTVLR